MSIAIATGVAMWTLLTVTRGADVHQDTTFPNEHACREGESVVLYGKTLEENAASDAKIKAEKEAEDKKWRDAHPPRVPVTKEEKEMARAYKESHAVAGTIGSSSTYTIVGDDGLLYDEPPNMFISYGGGAPDSHEVKYTKCFLSK